MATRTIAIANQKGGVGKTTTVVNLGAGLAAAGFNTLLVDLDAQGQVSKYFSLEPERTVFDVLVRGLPAEAAIYQVRPRLAVLPAAKNLAEAKEILTSRRRREELLLSALKPVAREYDFVLLDCAPSLDVLNINALIAATEVILPVSCDYLALDGAREHLATVEEMQREGYGLGVRAILPTFLRSARSQEPRRGFVAGRALQWHRGRTDPQERACLRGRRPPQDDLRVRAAVDRRRRLRPLHRSRGARLSAPPPRQDIQKDQPNDDDEPPRRSRRRPLFPCPDRNAGAAPGRAAEEAGARAARQGHVLPAQGAAGADSRPRRTRRDLLLRGRALCPPGVPGPPDRGELRLEPRLEKTRSGTLYRKTLFAEDPPA